MGQVFSKTYFCQNFPARGAGAGNSTISNEFPGGCSRLELIDTLIKALKLTEASFREWKVTLTLIMISFEFEFLSHNFHILISCTFQGPTLQIGIIFKLTWSIKHVDFFVLTDSLSLTCYDNEQTKGLITR